MRTPTPWGALGAFSLALGLACGGLPLPASPDAAADVADPVEAPPPDPAAEPPPPLPAPGEDPYALFPPLDASEVAPKASDPKCPDGASVIRYPRANGLEVYCATTAGMKMGPWQRVAGRDITEVREYADGQQVGRAVRWAKGVKIAEEQWVAGFQEGDVGEWNDAGILMLRGTMKASKRHGKFLLRAPAQPDAFDGRCFTDGAETWATTDPAEFVTKECTTP